MIMPAPFVLNMAPMLCYGVHPGTMRQFCRYGCGIIVFSHPAAHTLVSPLLQAAGVRTKVGTWALSEAEAAMIELSADRDEKWEASLAGKEQWLHKPLQPPGLLRSGALHCIRCCRRGGHLPAIGAWARPAGQKQEQFQQTPCALVRNGHRHGSRPVLRLIAAVP